MTSQAQVRDVQAAPVQPARDRMPVGVRWVLLGVVGALFAGAIYLIAVRGDALLIDLQALSRVFCF
jgi:hypothetical protein